MSKSRKILSVVLALVMTVSVFAIVANAASTSYETDDTYTQTWTLGEPVKVDDTTYTVDVSLKTNYATGAIQFVVTNTDSSVAALSGVKLGAAVPTAYNATISKSAKGKVVIIPSTAGEDSITAKAIDGVVATLTYTYSGSGSATIAIENSPKSATNVSGSLIAARMSNGDLVTGNLITGQKVTSVGESRTIGSAASPELVAKTGTTGYVDETRGFVYGVDIGAADPCAYFEATNGGYIEMTANDSGVKNGTGATLTLYNNSSKSTAIKSYTLVIFGDVNCDGAVDAMDVGVIKNHAAFVVLITDPAILFAADVNADATVDAMDVGVVKNHAAFVVSLAANVWAA